MANSPNKITRSTSLADLLATAVSDGTYSDVLETTKTDRTGEEAAATQIPEYPGQLIANLWDDATIRVVEMYDRGTKVWLPADAAARDALGSDDNLEANALCMLADTKAMYYCVSVDGGAASTWAALPATGNISGPGLTTDHAIVRWDGAVGGVVQNSVVVVSDAGAVSGVTNISLSGTVDGRDVSADGATLDAHVADISNPHSVLLSQALAAGNDTDGTHVVVTNGDEINGEDGGYVRFAAGTGVVQLSDAQITGDLEVTGMVDPIALVLVEQASSPWVAAAGGLALWAKNDTPTTLWFTDDAGNDYRVDVATGHTLASIMLLGNQTGASNLVVTDGTSILGSAGSGSIGGALPLQAGTGDAANPGGTASLTGGTGGPTGNGGGVQITGGEGGGTSGDGGWLVMSGGNGVASNSDGGYLQLSGGQASGTGSPGSVTISVPNAVSGNVTGGAITVDAGDGFGTGVGGALALSAGSGDSGIGTATGGTASLSGGAGGGTSGVGGPAYVVGGAGLAGNSAGGEAGCLGGVGQGSAAGGTARIQGGDGGVTGAGGIGRVRGGAGGATSGTGGVAEIVAGAGSAATATGGAAKVMGGAGGSGAATGGAVEITSGAGGGTSGNSGAITIASGAVTSGTRGVINLDASSVVVTNQGYHSVRGATVRGAVNTLIYRWTSVVDNVGTDITYTDDANAGGSWGINNAGVYAVSVSIDVGHNGYIAIKKAAAVSNTFDATDIMVASEASTGITQTMSWTGYCAAGDDIWIATSSASNPTGTPVNNNRVTVTRVR